MTRPLRPLAPAVDTQEPVTRAMRSLQEEVGAAYNRGKLSATAFGGVDGPGPEEVDG